MSQWLDFSNNSNKLKQSYVTGFLDISGTGINLRNNSDIKLFNQENASTPEFSIDSQRMRVYDGISEYYDISNSNLIYLKDLTQDIKADLTDLFNRTKHISTNGSNIDTYLDFNDICGNIILHSNIIPASPNTYDLGSEDFPFNSLYINQGTIHFINPQTKAQSAALSYNETDGQLYLNSAGSAAPLITTITTLPTLLVSGDTSLNTNVYVGGNTIFYGDASVNGNLYAHYPDNSIPSSAVANWRNEYGAINVTVPRADKIEYDDEFFELSMPSGKTPSDNLEFFYLPYTDLSYNGQLSINGNGQSNINGDLDLRSRLMVEGDVSMNNKMYINNDVSMNSLLDLSGSLIARSDINVYGVINQQALSYDETGYYVDYGQETQDIIQIKQVLSIIDGNVQLGISGNSVEIVGDLSTNGIHVTTITKGANTLLGSNAGSNITTGTNLTCLGYSSQPSSIDATNEITLGNSSISTLRCQVNTITSVSDKRDKKDIEPIPLGLDFIQKLNPVKFVWNMRDGSKTNIEEFGFIAQELKEVEENIGIKVPNLVCDNNPDKIEASYGSLLPIMVKSIQDLREIVMKQQSEIQSLKLSMQNSNHLLYAM